MKSVLLILAFLSLVPRTAVLAEPTPDDVTIEALIDGNTELRVKKTGFYWINTENWKVGMHDKGHEPTYVNGKPWHPVWGRPYEPTGQDKTSLHSMPLDPANLEFVLLAVGAVRGTEGIEKRDDVQVKMVGNDLSIFIPDTQIGARWYKFALRKMK